MNQPLQDMYKVHHATKKRHGFSVLEVERGNFFEKIIGMGKKVLDIGCRDGTLTKYFVEGNRVTGADVDNDALVIFAKKFSTQTVSMDLNGEWQELGDAQYDVIVAGEVIEHLYYPDRVCERVLRHLKNDGLFLGSVPNAFHLKNRLRYLFGSKKYTPLEDPTHINHFLVSDIQQILAKYFLSVEIVGLGRWKTLSRLYPNWFAFDIVFIARTPRHSFTNMG